VTPAAKLAAFAVVLAGLFGGGVALGAAVGPFDADEEPPTHVEAHEP
jgi:hypothetical protein